MHRIHRIALGVGLAVAATAATVRSVPAMAHPGRLGPDLFLAVGKGDLPAVKALLRRGADPNARNFLKFTPLIFAAVTGELEIARTLLGAGAQVNASSLLGTALTAAELGGSAPVANLLLRRGARVDPQRADKITTVMLAARSDHTEVLGRLLHRRANVNARDRDGMTALMYAARHGRRDATRLLLRRGAAMNAADRHGWSALTFAAANGQAAVVRLLLDHGALADHRDGKGRTPLLVAASYTDEPATLAALIDAGADPFARDRRDRTALTLALTRGKKANADTLKARAPGAVLEAGPAPELSPRAAVAASLPLLERSMRLFSERTACVSCHHEGIGRLATGLARRQGLAYDGALALAQAQRIARHLALERPLVLKALKEPERAKELRGVEIGELVPFYAIMLSGMVAHDVPSDPTLASAALLLSRQQAADGHWQFGIPRGPTQSSFFTMTAMALQALRTYAPRTLAAEIDWRTRRAKKWLLTAPGVTTEDEAFRLLGLKWAGASRDEKHRTTKRLLARQQSDGGWAPGPGRRSDAYATGQALFALNQAGGLPVNDLAYQRGVRFLLQNQEDDGSWFVTKEAMPANSYFDAGFPHGQSQYISHAATSWATMALLLTIDPPGAVPTAMVRRSVKERNTDGTCR